MLFVNEYASDEDVRAFDLNGIWDKYHPLWEGDYYLGHKPKWTIARDERVFLMVIDRGREELSNRTTFLLWIDGKHVIVILDLSPESSSSLAERPFLRVWDLVSIQKPADFSMSDKQILQMLKDALIVFGCDGIRCQIPDTVVECRF